MTTLETGKYHRVMSEAALGQERADLSRNGNVAASSAIRHAVSVGRLVQCAPVSPVHALRSSACLVLLTTSECTSRYIASTVIEEVRLEIPTHDNILECDQRSVTYGMPTLTRSRNRLQQDGKVADLLPDGRGVNVVCEECAMCPHKIAFATKQSVSRLAMCSCCQSSMAWMRMLARMGH